MPELPRTNECPYCDRAMRVSQCACDACAVKIEGEFPSIPLGNLPTAHQRFIEMFVLASGNLKEIASHAGVSYPTVRNRLDKVIAALRDEITTEQKRSSIKKTGKTVRGPREKGKDVGKSSHKQRAGVPDGPSVAEIIKQI